MSDIILRCQNVSKAYKDAGESVYVLKSIELEVLKGQTLAILGSSGSGKSTLLHLLGTLDKADEGQILFNDIDLQRLNAKQQAAFRNEHLGFIYQFHHLLPEFSALENVAMPLLIAKRSKTQAYALANDVLTQVGLSHRAKHKPWQLSGGERQRIAIARAIINSPSIVLADEPTGNLDAQNSQQIVELMMDINQRLGTTFVIVTHDVNLAKQMQSTVTLKNGRF